MKCAALPLLVGAAACASPPPPTALGLTLRRAEAGMVAETVAPDTPAAMAGLRPGDILMRYNGAWLLDEPQARALIADTVPGSTVELEFLREGRVQRIFVPF
jgi:serine protease Do